MIPAWVKTGRIWSTTLVTAAVMLFTFNAGAQELVKFERLLDRVEMGFWRALFSPENSETRASFQRYTGELLQCAQDIKRLQYMNKNTRIYGDLTGGSSKLTQIITSHSAFRKKRISVSGIKRTDLNSFRRTWRPQGSTSKRIKTMPAADIPMEDYKMFLDEVIESNLNSLSKKFNSNRDLSFSQREMLRKTAENFYTIIKKLRVSILSTRKYDPLFKAEKSATVTR